MNDESKIPPGTQPSTNRMSDSERDIALANRLRTVGEKRKRGRPPGSKNKSESRVDNTSRNVSANAEKTSERDCAFFVETVVSLCEVGDGYLREVFLAKLRLYVRNEEQVSAFREKLLNPASLGERDKEILRQQLTALALKYDILRKIGPEVGLLVFAAQYAFRMIRVSNFIESQRPIKKVEPVN